MSVAAQPARIKPAMANDAVLRKETPLFNRTKG
jgi:hypothetical protein